jgi:acetyl esterase/lipase
VVNSPASLSFAIRWSRKRGPGRPARRILRKVTLSEQTIGGLFAFHARLRNGTDSPLCLLYLHGGAHLLDLLAIQWRLVAGLLDRTRGEAFVPIFPLGPEAEPRQTLDAVAGMFGALAASRGAGKIVIMGDSSGGGLALLLVQRLRDEGSELPSALILFSPWLDLGLRGVTEVLQRRDPLLKAETARRAARLWARSLPLEDPSISPLYADQNDLPPILVFSGDRDILHADALGLEAVNASVRLHAYPGMPHVWPVAPLRQSAQAFDEAAAFALLHATGGENETPGGPAGRATPVL